MDGHQVDKMTQSCHITSLSERSVGEVPVVGPIWRGGIKISGKYCGELDGLEVFIPKIFYPKVVKLKLSLQKSICFCMKSRPALWPHHFDDVGAAHSDIELFMLPEVSRSEIDYNELVELMISNDLAMTSRIGNLKLIIFTSLEQEDNHQHIQGKYYLWGILNGNGLKRCKSSKGKNTNAEKKRISKSMRASGCAKKLNSSLSGRSAPCVDHQPITTTHFRYNFVPSLSQGCKRPRSKRGRISRTLKEVCDVHKSVVADFPGTERKDQESNGIVPVKWHQALGKSRQAQICANIEQVQVENDSDITVMKKKPVMVSDGVDNLSKKDALTSLVGGDVMKGGMTNRGSPLLDLAEEVTINTETKGAEQRSWDSNMEIDGPSDSSAIDMKETEVEHCSWDSDMEIDEPLVDHVKEISDDVELQAQSNVSQAMDADIKACLTPLKSEEFPVQEVPDSAIDVTRASFSDKTPERIKNMILRLNEDSTGDGPVPAPMATTDSKIHSCLIPLLHYKEGLDPHEAYPSTPGETSSYLDEKALVSPSNTSNSVADDHKSNELQDTMPGISEISIGRQLVDRIDQLECQISDPLPEMDSCRTPVHTSEEPGPCSSSSSTLVLELDEEETAMKGTEHFNEGSDVITTTSMLNIADHFLETSSDTLRIQVGQYEIKSDLAPILMKILIKYGDIGMGCSMMPETVLEDICKAFQDLEQVSFKDLHSRHLDRLRDLCGLGEALEIDMKWLYNRCDELEKTVLQLSQYSFLKRELAQCNNSIKSLDENVDLNRSTVVKLLEEKKSMEEEVESLTEHREKLQCEIEDVGFQSRRFMGKSLVDGLL